MVLPLVHQVYQVFLGAEDPRDPRASQDHPVLEVLRDHKGTKATRESLETKASQVNRDIQEKWDLKGTRADRVHEGDAGDKGSQGAPGLQGPPGALGTNWKQCVFKNLNEGKDTGLIKVFFFHLINCNFTKPYLTMMLLIDDSYKIFTERRSSCAVSQKQKL